METTLFQDPAFWLLTLFLIPLLLRVPIALSLGFAALVVVWKWDMGFSMLSYNFFAGIAKFPLLAIPFFILAGYIMERAGIAARIVALMEALTGSMTGGLAVATFWGAVSGSGPATVAALGLILIPGMAMAGYDKAFAAATVSVTSGLAIVIPPSIAFIVYGGVANVSVPALFAAGFIPGVIVAVLGASGLARLGIDSSFINLTITYTVLVVGLQFTMTPLNTWGVNSLDNAVIQHAEGLSSTMNQVAGSFGTAVLVSVAALAPAAAPDLPAFEQAYMGEHMAYTTTFALMGVAALVIIVFARDKRRAPGAAAATAVERGGEPVDIAAGISGVVVDGTQGETWDASRTYVAADVMNREPVCAADTATMEEVIRLMDANQTSGLPVVDGEGTLVGFVSDGDVASYLGKTEISFVDSTLNLYRYIDDEDALTRLRELMALNVMAVATHRVISVDATTPIDEVCALFAAKRIKKVPVVENGKLVGALSRRNIMRSLVEAIDILEK